jgi:hypothetical protein
MKKPLLFSENGSLFCSYDTTRCLRNATIKGEHKFLNPSKKLTGNQINLSTEKPLMVCHLMLFDHIWRKSKDIQAR